MAWSCLFHICIQRFSYHLLLKAWHSSPRFFLLYEKPDIGLESYDCYTNSIIAYYRIYNQDEAKVTSAKGYYGTSSASKSVNATVGGSRITVKFSGLKANTTYYIKCTATGKGGSGSSETTRLSTTD